MTRADLHDPMKRDAIQAEADILLTQAQTIVTLLSPDIWLWDSIVDAVTNADLSKLKRPVPVGGAPKRASKKSE